MVESLFPSNLLSAVTVERNASNVPALMRRCLIIWVTMKYELHCFA